MEIEEGEEGEVSPLPPRSAEPPPPRKLEVGASPRAQPLAAPHRLLSSPDARGPVRFSPQSASASFQRGHNRTRLEGMGGALHAAGEERSPDLRRHGAALMSAGIQQSPRQPTESTVPWDRPIGGGGSSGISNSGRSLLPLPPEHSPSAGHDSGGGRSVPPVQGTHLTSAAARKPLPRATPWNSSLPPANAPSQRDATDSRADVSRESVAARDTFSKPVHPLSKQATSSGRPGVHQPSGQQRSGSERTPTNQPIPGGPVSVRPQTLNGGVSQRALPSQDHRGPALHSTISTSSDGPSAQPPTVPGTTSTVPTRPPPSLSAVASSSRAPLPPGHPVGDLSPEQPSHAASASRPDRLSRGGGGPMRGPQGPPPLHAPASQQKSARVGALHGGNGELWGGPESRAVSQAPPFLQQQQLRPPVYVGSSGGHAQEPAGFDFGAGSASGPPWPSPQSDRASSGAARSAGLSRPGGSQSDTGLSSGASSQQRHPTQPRSASGLLGSAPASLPAALASPVGATPKHAFQQRENGFPSQQPSRTLLPQRTQHSLLGGDEWQAPLSAPAPSGKSLLGRGIPVVSEASVGAESTWQHQQRLAPPSGAAGSRSSILGLGGGGGVLGHFPAPTSGLIPRPGDLPVSRMSGGILGRPPPMLRSEKQLAWSSGALYPQQQQHHAFLQNPLHQPMAMNDSAGWGSNSRMQQPVFDSNGGRFASAHFAQFQPSASRLMPPPDYFPSASMSAMPSTESALTSGIADDIDMSILPEGEAGAEGRALRLEADDGDDTGSSVDEGDASNDDDAADPSLSSLNVAERRAAVRLRKGVSVADGKPVSQEPPVVVPVGDGSLIPARFALSLGPLLEALAANSSVSQPSLPVIAPSNGGGSTSLLGPQPPAPIARAVSAPQLLSPVAAVSSAPPLVAPVGIASFILQDAGVDLTVSSTAPPSAPLPSTVSKDRIISAMEALETFSVRAAEGIAAVESSMPDLKSKAIALRSSYMKQQQDLIEVRRQAAENAAAAAADAAAAAAALAAAAVSHTLSSEPRTPICIFQASDVLTQQPFERFLGIPHLPLGLPTGVVAAVNHLLSVLFSWSPSPLWLAQLCDASSDASSCGVGAPRSGSGPFGSCVGSVRADALTADAVLSARLWHQLNAVASGSVQELRIQVTFPQTASETGSARLQGASLALRFHRGFSENFLFAPDDPEIVALNGSSRSGATPTAYLHKLPATFPRDLSVISFSLPRGLAGSHEISNPRLLYASITTTAENLALSAVIDAENAQALPPLLRSKRGSHGVMPQSHNAVPFSPPLVLSSDSLLLHRRHWRRAVSLRSAVNLSNRARAWMSQAENFRLASARTHSYFDYSLSVPTVDDASIPTVARVGKSAVRVRKAVEDAIGLRSRLLRLAVAESLRNSPSDVFGVPCAPETNNTMPICSKRPLLEANKLVHHATSVFSWRLGDDAPLPVPLTLPMDVDAAVSFLTQVRSVWTNGTCPSVPRLVAARYSVELVVNAHLRAHIEGSLLLRRSALRAQQHAAAVAFVSAFRAWRDRRLRLARSRRNRIRLAHSRELLDHHQTFYQQALSVPSAQKVAGSNRRTAAGPAVSSGSTPAILPDNVDAAANETPNTASPGANYCDDKRPHRHRHSHHSDILVDPDDDLASDSGDDANLVAAFSGSRFGSSDVVRSELELQQRLSEMAERERRAQFRLSALCPIPERFPDLRDRSFWTRVYYSAGNRLTADGAPPLCTDLPFRVPCAAMRPSPLLAMRSLAQALDTSSSAALAATSMMGSADDWHHVARLIATATNPAIADVDAADERGGIRRANVNSSFIPSSADNVPSARRRLWMGGCNCPVAVELERQSTNPWSDAEKVIFMDKFMQVRFGAVGPIGGAVELRLRPVLALPLSSTTCARHRSIRKTSPK
jgi:hypothetical protein